MKIYSDFITEIGFSGRSIRNVDPIQHMIRSILSGDMELDVIDPLKDNVKNRIINDLWTCGISIHSQIFFTSMF